MGRVLLASYLPCVMENPITAVEVQQQVGHWLRSPVNSYLGSDYGNDLPRLQMTPLSSQRADDQIAKLKVDVPVLQELPKNAINVFAKSTPPDRVDFLISVAGSIMASASSR